MGRGSVVPAAYFLHFFKRCRSHPSDPRCCPPCSVEPAFFLVTRLALWASASPSAEWYFPEPAFCFPWCSCAHCDLLLRSTLFELLHGFAVTWHLLWSSVISNGAWCCPGCQTCSSSPSSSYLASSVRTRAPRLHLDLLL